MFFSSFHMFLCNFLCMFLRKISNQSILIAQTNLLLESLGNSVPKLPALGDSGVQCFLRKVNSFSPCHISCPCYQWNLHLLISRLAVVWLLEDAVPASPKTMIVLQKPGSICWEGLSPFQELSFYPIALGPGFDFLCRRAPVWQVSVSGLHLLLSCLAPV